MHGIENDANPLYHAEKELTDMNNIRRSMEVVPDAMATEFRYNPVACGLGTLAAITGNKYHLPQGTHGDDNARMTRPITCRCSNMGMEWTLNKSPQRVNTAEENSSAKKKVQVAGYIYTYIYP